MGAEVFIYELKVHRLGSSEDSRMLSDLVEGDTSTTGSSSLVIACQYLPT